MATKQQLERLRQAITENLRVQRGGADSVPYIDAGNVLQDVCARQNHVIFARRGCGKTLLLQHSSRELDPSIKAVYLNCEDFKRHSFPNVLIEILDTLFLELEKNLSGWFGKRRQSRNIIATIRKEFDDLKTRADAREASVRELTEHNQCSSVGASTDVSKVPATLHAKIGATERVRAETERTYKIRDDKVRELDMKLPRLKKQIREFFDISSTVKAVFLQVDDFYHLNRDDQPLVMDYIHRLCKDLPLYFKIATLKHATTLYADRAGQPIGAQERHDYQPINIDFTFSDFRRTRDQNQRILREFGRLAEMKPEEVDGLFRGEGLERLVLAGGGVPRDFLSLFFGGSANHSEG